MGEQSTNAGNASVDTQLEVKTEGQQDGAAEETAGKAPEESAEVKRLKAELAKAKAATDKATKEAGDYKKQLRAKQTAEESAAEEAKALQEQMQTELQQLRKEKAVSAATAKIIPIVGGNGELAGQIAEYLYGAEDVEAAIDAIGKAWTEREKKLTLELKKIQAPAAGSSSGSTITLEQLNGMKYVDRVKFASEHPDEYNKLMGRT